MRSDYTYHAFLLLFLYVMYTAVFLCACIKDSGTRLPACTNQFLYSFVFNVHSLTTMFCLFCLSH